MLAVEDDAVAAPNFLSKLQAAVEEVESQGHDWLYLKLWYTEHFWGFEKRDIPALSVLGLVGVQCMRGLGHTRRSEDASSLCTAHAPHCAN